MSNGLSLVLIQVAFCGDEGVCLRGRKFYSVPGSYESILDFFLNQVFFTFFFFNMKEVPSFVSLHELYVIHTFER